MQYIVDLSKQDRCKIIVLTSDFNADPDIVHGKRFQRLCDENVFTLHINEPTRITD